MPMSQYSPALKTINTAQNSNSKNFQQVSKSMMHIASMCHNAVHFEPCTSINITL